MMLSLDPGQIRTDPQRPTVHTRTNTHSHAGLQSAVFMDGIRCKTENQNFPQKWCVTVGCSICAVSQNPAVKKCFKTCDQLMNNIHSIMDHHYPIRTFHNSCKNKTNKPPPSLTAASCSFRFSFHHRADTHRCFLYSLKSDPKWCFILCSQEHSLMLMFPVPALSPKHLNSYIPFFC